jgi:hypothetical protein
MPSSYVSGRVISDQTEHSRAIIVDYVPSGHYFRSLFPSFHRSHGSPRGHKQSLDRSSSSSLNPFVMLTRWWLFRLPPCPRLCPWISKPPACPFSVDGRAHAERASSGASRCTFN